MSNETLASSEISSEPKVELGVYPHFLPFNANWNAPLLGNLMEESGMPPHLVKKSSLRLFSPGYEGTTAEIDPISLSVGSMIHTWGVSPNYDGGIHINAGSGIDKKYEQEKLKYLEYIALQSSRDSSSISRLEYLRGKLHSWPRPDRGTPSGDLAGLNYEQAAALVDQKVLNHLRDNTVNQIIMALRFTEDITSIRHLGSKIYEDEEKMTKVTDVLARVGLFSGFGALLLEHGEFTPLVGGVIASSVAVRTAIELYKKNKTHKINDQIDKKSKDVEFKARFADTPELEVTEKWRGILTLTPKSEQN